MYEKLNKYANNITSQHGEDGILEYIINSINSVGDRIIPIACEFGAWDGIFASNVYNLWANKQWKALLIEGDKQKAEELKKNTAQYENVICVSQFVNIRGENSLDDIVTKNNFSTKIGVLSIDIDSTDYHIWKNIEKVDAQVVVIEHNQYIPPHVEYFDPEGEVFLRCSAKALEKLGFEKGYKLICCTKTNSIFIKNELFDDAFFPSLGVETLFDYSELRSQVIFTGNDGNKFPVFCNKTSASQKMLLKTYYFIESIFKRNQKFETPSSEVRSQLEKFNLKF